MNIKNLKNCMMGENMVKTPRDENISGMQDMLLDIKDYVETLEKHIDLENPLWLKKFIKEYKQTLFTDNIESLYKELK